MGEAKIAAFYDDPVKQACDALSVRKAYRLRSVSIDPALPWAALRWVKFAAHWSRGILGRLPTATASSNHALEEEHKTKRRRGSAELRRINSAPRHHHF